MTQARPEVRTPSAAPPPATGHREHRPARLHVLESRDAVLSGGTGTMIHTIPRLTVAAQRRASLAEPATASEADPARGAADTDAYVANSPVTTEELAILALMASGLTLDSVAVRVSMSQRTLSRRLRCVCDRLGVAHPIQAIVWAARRGLI